MIRKMAGQKKVSVGIKQMASMPSSPIASKVRRGRSDSTSSDEGAMHRLATMNVPKPQIIRRDSTNEVFSPARWRSDSREEEIDQSRPAAFTAQPAAVAPRGDPLGVMYAMLEEDPDLLLFMNTVPRVVPKCFTSRKPDLSPRTSALPKNTLVLDLDETLVHCTTEVSEVETKPDAEFDVTFNGVDYTVYMNKRPYLDMFLEKVNKWFEVVVFTASQKCYADKVLKLIDPEGTLIKHICYRGSCAHYMDNFLKPLGILGRDLKNCFIIDNSPQCFSFEIDNGIPCTSWFDDKRDTELMRLLPLLREMEHLDDVRPYLNNVFGVDAFLKYLDREMNGSIRCPMGE